MARVTRLAFRKQALRVTQARAAVTLRLEVSHMQASVEKHRPEIVEVCGQYGVLTLVVFGSATTDDFDEERSDVDLLVEFSRDVPGRACCGVRRDLPYEAVYLPSQATTSGTTRANLPLRRSGPPRAVGRLREPADGRPDLANPFVLSPDLPVSLTSVRWVTKSGARR